MDRNAAIALKNQRIEELGRKKQTLSERQDNIQIDLETLMALMDKKQMILHEAMDNLATLTFAKREILKCVLQDFVILLMLGTFVVFNPQYVLILGIIYAVIRVPKYWNLIKILSNFKEIDLNKTIFKIKNEIMDGKKEEDAIRNQLREIGYRLLEVDVDIHVQNEIKNYLESTNEVDKDENRDKDLLRIRFKKEIVG